MARPRGLLGAFVDLIQALLKFLLTISMVGSLRRSEKAQRRLATRLDDDPQPFPGGLSISEQDLDQFARGDIARLNVGLIPGIALQPGERGLMLIDGYELMDQVSDRGRFHSLGVSSGGLSLRTGKIQLGGSGMQRRSLGRGRLVITTQRLIFSGDSTTLDLPLSRIVSFQPHKSGFDLGVSGQKKTYTFYAPLDGRLPCAILQGAIASRACGDRPSDLPSGSGTSVTFRIEGEEEGES